MIFAHQKFLSGSLSLHFLPCRKGKPLYSRIGGNADAAAPCPDIATITHPFQPELDRRVDNDTTHLKQRDPLTEIAEV